MAELPKLVPSPHLTSPHLPIYQPGMVVVVVLVVLATVHAAGSFVIGWQVGATPQQPMMSEWWLEASSQV